MPGGVEVGQGRLFCFPLLNAVFAEMADDGGGVRLADGLRRNRLGNRDESDLVGITFGARGGANDALADSSNVVSDGHGNSLGGNEERVKARGQGVITR